jgi:enoyl-CoA hydratase
VIQTETIQNIAIVTLANKKNLNVLSRDFVAEFNKEIDIFSNDPFIKVIIVRGEDTVFSAGGNIREFENETLETAFQTDFIKAWCQLSTCPKIVLIQIQGLAIGGGLELALQGDIIFAAKSVRFGLPEIKIGAVPGSGGSVNLLQMIGYQKTMALCLTGDFIDAETAKQLGVIYDCVDDDRLEDTVLSFAKRIAQFSLESLCTIKDNMRFALHNNLGDSLIHERHSFYKLFGSAHMEEGMRAFFEKRTPDFD